MRVLRHPVSLLTDRAPPPPLVSVQLIGEASVKWTERSGNSETTYRARLDIINEVAFVVPPLRNEAPIELSAGSHFEWPFTFLLPINSPPSMELSKGHVRYRLELRIRKHGMFSLNINQTVGVKCLGSFDPVLAQRNSSVAIGTRESAFALSNGGAVLEAALPRTALICGSELRIKVRLNNRSTEINRSARVWLSQHAVLSVKGRHKTQSWLSNRVGGRLLVSEYQVGEIDLAFRMPDLKSAFVNTFDLGIIKLEHRLHIATDSVDMVMPVVLLAPLPAAAIALQTMSVDPPSFQRIFRPPWQRDDDALACGTCDAAFGLFRRRHHCRGCGRVYCNTCCRPDGMRMPAVYGFGGTLQRVCIRCREQPGGVAANARQLDDAVAEFSLVERQQQRQAALQMAVRPPQSSPPAMSVSGEPNFIAPPIGSPDDVPPPSFDVAMDAQPSAPPPEEAALNNNNDNDDDDDADERRFDVSNYVSASDDNNDDGFVSLVEPAPPAEPPIVAPPSGEPQAMPPSFDEPRSMPMPPACDDHMPTPMAPPAIDDADTFSAAERDVFASSSASSSSVAAATSSASSSSNDAGTRRASLLPNAGAQYPLLQGQNERTRKQSTSSTAAPTISALPSRAALVASISAEKGASHIDIDLI